MAKHFHLGKNDLSMSDVWVFLVVLLFTIVIDVVYVMVHFYLGIQLSDYWLLCNVIFYGIEIICITSVNIVKKLKPDQREVYKEIAAEVSKGLGQGIASTISDSISFPSMTSGERSCGQSEGADYEDAIDMPQEDDDDGEEEGEPVG